MNKTTLLALLLTPALLQANPLVFEGTKEGLGSGKHIVFIADDHEYRSEEALPALARILAKHHGFKCTVLFGIDEDGYINPGHPNVPGIEVLDDADLMVVYTRFQNWPDEQMQHFVNYLDRGGPVVGLRTATHAFKIPADGTFHKYSQGTKDESYEGGFGRQVLGEDWSGHYGKNNVSSTRLDIVAENKDHPTLIGIDKMHASCGGYFTEPLQPSTILAMAQPLQGMSPDDPADPDKEPVPGIWVRSYPSADGQTEGRVFTTTYGASNDLLDEGFRRALTNGCIWAIGLEDEITPDLDVSLVGPYNPSWAKDNRPKRNPKTKPEDLAGWDTPIFPIEN
ncbi:MAG: ThuA domain-containing protein [Verrucomicrobiota bacterium]